MICYEIISKLDALDCYEIDCCEVEPAFREFLDRVYIAFRADVFRRVPAVVERA